MNDSHLKETTLSSEDIFQGKLLHIKRDRVQLPDGSEAVREYTVHPGAVLIVPCLANGKLLFERQFRYPLQRVFVEFPAGKIDPHETSMNCARRELLEETGYRANKLEWAATTHTVISYSTEYIEVYFADELEYVGQQLDHGEFVETFELSLTEAMAWQQESKITDAKTVLALLLYYRRRQNYGR